MTNKIQLSVKIDFGIEKLIQHASEILFIKNYMLAPKKILFTICSTLSDSRLSNKK